MKLYETTPELRNPITRRIIVLGAATFDAALEGMEDSVKANLDEIDKLRRMLAFEKETPPPLK
jgi:hypothetical protein